MLKTIFLNNLGISIVTGVTACAVVALRAFFSKRRGKRIAAKWMCICWMMLSLRLLIPFNLPISLFEVKIPDAQISEGVAELSNGQQTAVDVQGAITQSSATNTDFLKIAVWVWFTGIAMFLLRQLVLYFYERRKMLRWSRMADSDTCAIAEQIAESIGISRNFRVLICETDAPPMLMGVMRPVLFLPVGLNDKQRKIALCHELTHLKRQDIMFKILVTAANAVHWFDPLVYILAREADKDAESACDEEVLRNADRASRRSYCDTILDMMCGRRIPFATALTYKKEDIVMRFMNILDTSKRKSGLALAVVLLCVCVVLCGLVGCTQDKNVVKEEDVPTAAADETDTDDGSLTEYFNWDDGEMDAERAMELINEYRVRNGLNELTADNGKLKKIAEIRLEEAKELFSHTRPNGKNWKTVYEEEGLAYTGACENLARGQLTAGQVLNDWLNSPVHYSNLTDPNITYGCVVCSEGEYDGVPYVYWIFLAYAP